MPETLEVELTRHQIAALVVVLDLHHEEHGPRGSLWALRQKLAGYVDAPAYQEYGRRISQRPVD